MNQALSALTRVRNAVKMQQDIVCRENEVVYGDAEKIAELGVIFKVYDRIMASIGDVEQQMMKEEMEGLK